MNPTDIKKTVELDDDGFALVLKGKKNKLKRNNDNITFKHTDNDVKKNNQKREQFLSNFNSNLLSKNNINSNNGNKKKNKLFVNHELTKEQQIGKLINSLKEQETLMKSTEFFKSIIESQTIKVIDESGTNFIQVFNNIHDVVCYGIGEFSNSKKCLEQLSWITCIKELYKITGSIYIFDPVMSEFEKEFVVNHLGFKFIEVNEECKRKVEITNRNDNNNFYSMFYMPFCGRKLYDNVLWSNWDTELLSRLIVVGNSFNEYNEGIVQPRESDLPYSYTKKVYNLYQEIPFPTNYPTPYTFHQISIHYFPSQQEAMLLDLEKKDYFKSSHNIEPPKLSSNIEE